MKFEKLVESFLNVFSPEEPTIEEGKHSYKEYGELIEIARQLGCAIKETTKGHILKAPESIAGSLPFNMRMLTVDRGDKAIYPIKRWLKNYLKLSHPVIDKL